MTATERNNGRANHDAIRGECDRLVAHPVLAKSPQLANFLTFIVDETLAGRGDRLRAYAIATDALGRDANFDPQSDPIVRVEAGRLRRALEQYYASDGRDDPIIIELPLGGYIPEFRAKTAIHRAVTRTQDWPTWTFGGLRDNDLLWMLIGKEMHPAAEFATEHSSPAAPGSAAH